MAEPGGEQQNQQRHEEKVPFWRTFFYAFGNAAGQLTYTTFNTYIQYFYTTVIGLKPQWVGRGLFAFGFWNAVNDPIAGWLSDRTQTRWGRRRFYIRMLAIPTSIAFAFVWLPPFDTGNPTAMLVYFLVIISIYDMLQTIITLNQDALFPEMYQGTHNRASGTAIRQFIGFLLGNGAAAALTPIIYGGFEDKRVGWTLMAVLWGVVASLFHFLSLKGIQENPALAQQENPTLRDQVRVVFNNRTFLIVLCINFVIRFILALLLAVMPFYADHVLHIEEEQLTLLQTALFVSAGLSLVFWQSIVKRYGSRTSMIVSMLGAAILATPLLVVNQLAQTAIVFGFLGFMVGGTLLGPDMLFAEVVDDDYVRTGKRREGMYRGMLGFIFRFPTSLAQLILGEGLAMAGFDADLAASAQPDAVATVIRLFSGILPLVAIVIGVLLLRVYPLYGQRLAEIQDRAAFLRRETYHELSGDQ